MVVQGGGLAGMAVAAYLRRSSKVASVVVVEASSAATRTGDRSARTGLWSNGIDALGACLTTSQFRDIIKGATFIDNSGFRGFKKGQWLVKTNGLSPYNPEESFASLGFFENAKLLEKLKDSCLSENGASVTIIENSEITEVLPSAVKTKQGTQISCDLLVAADGSDSRVYSMFHDETSSKRLKYRGYDLYRGTAELPVDAAPESFQSWGPGARFSLVLTSESTNHSDNYSSISDKRTQKGRPKNFSKILRGDKLNEYSWYAAVTGKEAGPGYITSGDCASSGNTNKMRRLVGPFTNGSSYASPAILGHIRSIFSDWHKPISKVLSQSSHIDHASVTVTPAWTSRAVEQVNKMYSVPVGCESFGSDLSDFPKDLQNESTKPQYQNDKMPVVFCGDAFHTFDPMLGIGASAALEQARILSQSLRSYDSSESSMENCIKEYNARVCNRAQTLSAASDMIEFLSNIQRM